MDCNVRLLADIIVRVPELRYGDILQDVPCKGNLLVQRDDDDDEDLDLGHPRYFHVACLELLQARLGKQLLPVSRLHDICASLPIELGLRCVSWDHGFGVVPISGEPDGNDDDIFPWESDSSRHLPSESWLSCDPLEIPGLPRGKFDGTIITRLPEAQPHLTKSASQQVGSSFSDLPVEVIEMIAGQLPTSDFLSLRTCSRAFGPILYSSHFWRTRFHGEGEFRWFFEAHDLNDLSSLIAAYKMVGRVRDSPHIRNRRRIWDLVSEISDLMSLRCSDQAVSSTFPLAETAHEWFFASGDIHPNDNELCYGTGCKLLHEFQISMAEVVRIEFFICATGSVKYICGLHLHDGSRTQMVGYCNSGRSMSVHAVGLSGFIVAVGSRGLHALQILYEGGRQSAWVGSPENCLLTERLNVRRPILAIRASFDVSGLSKQGQFEDSTN
jgi:hypothetical protein